MSNNIFDSSYIGSQTSTSTPKQASGVKKFLKEPIDSKQMNKYGTSKPRRVVIKAKIKNG